jgi:hypothetical protein
VGGGGGVIGRARTYRECRDMSRRRRLDASAVGLGVLPSGWAAAGPWQRLRDLAWEASGVVIAPPRTMRLRADSQRA